MFSELDLLTGLPVPAPPFAQRAATIPDANPLAKLLVKKEVAWTAGSAAGDVAGRTLKLRRSYEPASSLRTQARNLSLNAKERSAWRSAHCLKLRAYD
jgi:hypothetical protein